MDYRYKQLEQQVSALVSEFTQLAAHLGDVAKEVSSPGIMPSGKLLERISASRSSFEDTRKAVYEHAAQMLVSPLPNLAELVSVVTIESLLKSGRVAEENRCSLETERERALEILSRALSLRHKEAADFKPLQDCRAALESLHNAVSGVLWPRRHPEAEPIVSGKHPVNALLEVSERWADLDDDRWMVLEETVTKSYSKPLFVAASRGKLALKDEKRQAPKTEAPKPEATRPEAAPAGVKKEHPTAPVPAAAAATPVTATAAKKEVAIPVANGPAPTPVPAQPVAADRPGTKHQPVTHAAGPAAPAPAASAPAALADKKETAHGTAAPAAPVAAAPAPAPVVTPAQVPAPAAAASTHSAPAAVAELPVQPVERERKDLKQPPLIIPVSKEPRLATPAPQPVLKSEPESEENLSDPMADEVKKAAGDEVSQRPQRWGFWRGNR